ncbi:MAG: class I SAM-dependent methyltransferase [Candidatus Rokuibacteriota bacterium]
MRHSPDLLEANRSRRGGFVLVLAGTAGPSGRSRRRAVTLRRADLNAVMVSAREHYDEVLSQHYSRMFGAFEVKVVEQQALLERLGVTAAHAGRVAVDLGCGSGFQSIALARLGFRVVAIDFSRRLLAELNERARGLPVESIAGDIRDVAELAPAAVELVVCMGDTLSHLEHEEDLELLFDGVAERLAADADVDARHLRVVETVEQVGHPDHSRRSGALSTESEGPELVSKA